MGHHCAHVGSASQPGVLHTQFGNLRNKRFRRARAILAQSCGYPSSRVPQRNGCSSRFTGTLATLWRVCRSLVCVTAPTDGREQVPASLRKSRSSAMTDVRRRTIWANSLGECARPHIRTTQDPVRTCHGSLLPAALGPHCSNTHQSLQRSRSAMISSPTVSAC